MDQWLRGLGITLEFNAVWYPHDLALRHPQRDDVIVRLWQKDDDTVRAIVKPLLELALNLSNQALLPQPAEIDQGLGPEIPDFENEWNAKPPGQYGT